MTRNASTYRQARRATYRAAVADGLKVGWAQFNAPARGKGYSYGEPRNIDYAGGVHVLAGRSKYMPHIGAKQRAKGLARAS